MWSIRIRWYRVFDIWETTKVMKRLWFYTGLGTLNHSSCLNLFYHTKLSKNLSTLRIRKVSIDKSLICSCSNRNNWPILFMKFIFMWNNWYSIFDDNWKLSVVANAQKQESISSSSGLWTTPDRYSWLRNMIHGKTLCFWNNYLLTAQVFPRF